MKIFGKLTAILLFALFMVFQSYAQDTKSHVTSKDNDSTSSNFDMMMDGDSIFHNNQPTIEIMYGMATPSIHKDVFSGKFSNVTAGEIRLGFSKTKDYVCKCKQNATSSIIDYSYNFLFLGKNSSDWNSKTSTSADEIRTNAWRFGFGSYSGWGYKLGASSDIVLYNGGSLVWTKPEFKDSAKTIEDKNVIDAYGNAFRFGERFEGGIKIKVYAPLSVNIGYERAVVFPRHMFWYWCGSKLVFGIGDGLISHFTKEIMKVSPYLGQVAGFILKNAYSYGVYQLEKHYMNWPIRTEAPLMYDSYKVGLSFAF